MNTVTFQNVDEFLDYNRQRIDANSLGFYNMTAIARAVQNGQFEFQSACAIEDENSWLICFWITHNMFLFYEGDIDALLTEFLRQVPMERFGNNFTFMGTRDLILRLFELSGVGYDLVKDRIFYECRVVQPVDNPGGNSEQSVWDDFDELSEMSFNYHNDEYNGQGWRTREEMANVTGHGLNQGIIYYWRNDDGTICSMLEVMEAESPTPLIGHFFTKAELRGRGYGKALLHGKTQDLLAEGKQWVGLNSDATNPASNAAFIAVGYRPVYYTALCVVVKAEA